MRKPTASRMAAAPRAALKLAESLPLEMEELPMPMNTWKPKDSLTCTVKSVERIVGPKATGETCHMIFDTEGKAPMWEGQSYGVVPPVSSKHTSMICPPEGFVLISNLPSRMSLVTPSWEPPITE